MTDRQAGSVPALPDGPEEILSALAGAMLRAALAVGLCTAVVAVAVAGIWFGAAGAVSALAGSVLAVVASLLTPWLIRRTSTFTPSAVMIASFGGFILKMIVLLVGLFGAGMVDGVHRESLAVSVLVVVVAVVTAEAVASYRMPTPVISAIPPSEPHVGGGTPAGSVTGMPD